MMNRSSLLVQIQPAKSTSWLTVAYCTIFEKLRYQEFELSSPLTGANSSYLSILRDGTLTAEDTVAKKHFIRADWILTFSTLQK